MLTAKRSSKTARTSDLLGALRERPRLCDGAMGTQLIAAGPRPGQCGEFWNIQYPDRVQAVHRAYAAAGSELLTTNTFAASTLALARHELRELAADINATGAALARATLGGKGWVLGNIGPSGHFVEPVGDVSSQRLVEAFKAQAAALRSGGA